MPKLTKNTTLKATTPDKPTTGDIVPLAVHPPKAHVWGMINVQTRDVASKLNQLSFEGKVIFSVNQSQHIGGTYEVIYYSLVDLVGE